MIDAWLLRYTHGARRYIAVHVAAQWIGLLCGAAAIFAIARFIGLIIAGTANTGTLVQTLAIACPAVLLRAGTGIVMGRMSFMISSGVKRRLREQLFTKLAGIGASYTETLGTAEVLQTATEGIDQLETYFGRYLPQFFYSIIAPITLFAILAPVSLRAAIVLLVCAPLIPLLLVGISAIAKKVMRRQWSAYTSLGDRFLENIQGMTTLKIYRADETRQMDMAAEAEAFRRSTMRVLRMQLGSIIFMDIVAFGGAALGVAAAVRGFDSGSAVIGTAAAGAIAAVLLSAEFFIPLRQLGSLFHVAMNGIAAGTRMFAILDAPVPLDGTLPVPEGELPLEIRNVHFSYAGEPTLADTSFSIPARGMIALAGESGCGKSTIAAILSGRRGGYGGSITLGNTELCDISRINISQCVTLMTHNGYVFTGTVRDNLRIAVPDASDQDMLSVLERVRLRELFDLREGLDTPLDERGANLSGGQQQRLCFARVLLRKARLYILDEATSNIDTESEEAIMSAVHTLAETAPVLLISHRLANIVPAKCIYVMDSGTIAESGAHPELLSHNGIYARLWREQCELESYAKGS